MPETSQERALLLGVQVTRSVSGGPAPAGVSAEESLDELAALARGAGSEVVGRILQVRSALEPATLVGSGKIEELKQIAGADEVDVIIVDHDLTPTQLRNLENRLECRVVDRTQLILDIFASRARTREGQLQVELAQLNYMLPRLTGRGVEMSRLGGGIGTRGPGETQLETDRRRIARRIQKIKQQLETVRRTRTVQRRQRRGVPLTNLAMVGYTNAGKSTLFNRLTGADVTADARMFATLDPTARLVVLGSRRRVVISDTVGFIRNLPTTLVEAFRATLEEVSEASLLLHVVDASSEHAEQHGAHVLEVLNEIGAQEIPQILVLNKADRLSGEIDAAAMLRRMLAEPGSGDSGGSPWRRAVAVSAKTGEGVAELLRTVDEVLPEDPLVRARFRFPAGAGGDIHLLHEYAKVLRRSYDGDVCEIEAEVSASVLRRLKGYVVKKAESTGSG